MQSKALRNGLSITPYYREDVDELGVHLLKFVFKQFDMPSDMVDFAATTFDDGGYVLYVIERGSAVMLLCLELKETVGGTIAYEMFCCGNNCYRFVTQFPELLSIIHEHIGSPHKPTRFRFITNEDNQEARSMFNYTSHLLKVCRLHKFPKVRDVWYETEAYEYVVQ